MKILIGICGIGQGHVTRQTVVAQHLLARGHQLSFIAYGPAVDHLRRQFPDSPVSDAYVPWVACDSSGVKVRESLARSGLPLIPGLLRDWRLIRKFKKGEQFDLCVSDYEPVAARVAYAADIPLVTLDQQSKMLGYETPPIGDLSRREERSRLKLFFPSATKRIALSFFSIDASLADEEFNVEVRPPIARGAVRGPIGVERPPHTMVYLSSYGRDSLIDLAKLVAMLGKVRGRHFTIVDSLSREVPLPSNVELMRADPSEFASKLAESDSVIATAGFNLIAECVKAELPMLAIPLQTYDQHLCAQMVQSLSIGTGLGSTRCPTSTELQEFFSSLPESRASLQSHESILRPTEESAVTLIDEIELAAS